MSRDSILKFSLLGKVKVDRDGEDLTGRISSKSIAILALLLIKEGKSCSRRQLMNYLWPESSENAARYNLRYNLWQLKRVLDDQEEEEPFIIITKDRCSINPARPCWCDVDVITKTDIKGTDDIEILENTAKLFRGDFLEDSYFAGCDQLDEMIILQRYNLENRRLELFKKLVSLYFEAGNSQKCMWALDVCEELDPYDEENASTRIKLLIENGKYTQAHKFYHRFCRRLAVDIGMEPSSGLKDMMGNAVDTETAEPELITITADGIPAIDFYYLSDALGKLLKSSGFRIEEYLPEEQIKDLAAVQRLLGTPVYPVHPARIADAFVSLICNMCGSGKKLELKLTEGSRFDRISEEILHLAWTRCGSMLVIKDMAE